VLIGLGQTFIPPNPQMGKKLLVPLVAVLVELRAGRGTTPPSVSRH